jgi:DNA-binding response OmpR family regulator
LLIIDKTLPTINGIELIETIRKEDSDIPIILMSGADEIIEKDLVHLGINKKIKKPFDFEFILSEIQELLF